jgi:membrane protein required for beta-lactamase induction
MILLALLIALALSRGWPAPELRAARWFTRWQSWLAERAGAFLDHAGGVLVALGGPLLMLALVQDGLDDVLWGLPALALGVLVFWYCLGPGDLDAEAVGYVSACRTGDVAAQQQAALPLLGYTSNESGPALTRNVTQSLFAAAHERLFAPLFWFALLGPLGAALWLLTLLARHGALAQSPGFADAARRLHAILAWLPARLTAFGYALCGSFEDALHAWRARAGGNGSYAESHFAVLVTTGLGALRVGTSAPEDVELQAEEVQTALALCWRALIAWLCLIALITLAGWVG